MKKHATFLSFPITFFRSTACSIALILWSVGLFGQDMLTATLANQQVHDFQRERIRSEYAREKETLHAGGGKLAGRNENFHFRADKSVVRKVEVEIVSDLKKRNPVAGQNLATVLGNTRPYPKYMAMFKTLGLDLESDYADVFTAYMLGMWRIANKMVSNPTEDRIRSVRNQVVNVLNISGLNDRERQEKAAYLVYDLILANEAYEGSRTAKDSKLMQEDSDAVQYRFLRENNLDLRNMTITENGLVPRR